MSNNTIGEDCKKIMKSISDYIHSNQKFPSPRVIADDTGLPYQRCVDRIKLLIGQDQLYQLVDGSKGIPTIVAPIDMMEGIFYSEKKPDWIEKDGYRFDEALKSVRKLEKITEELKMYDSYEKLLFSTGIPLEKAVAFALDFLEFSNVEHHSNDKDNADVTFEWNDEKFLLEIEGTSKQGDKGKILQLSGWMRKNLESGIEAEKLKGYFVVNNERDKTPEARGFPLTDMAVQYLKLYNFKFIKTVTLFSLIKQVHNGKITKEEARNVILIAEPIEDK